MKQKRGMLPEEVILEVTNYCNLRCRFCHIHGEGSDFRREKGYMARDIWRRILDEIAQWDGHVSLITHGAGEPLLYPHLFELLEEARRLSNLTLGFMTNGMLLDGDRARRLVDIGVDWIALSVDGPDPTLNDAVRVGARLEKIEANIDLLAQIKARRGNAGPQLHFNMVMYPHWKDQEVCLVQGFLRRWGEVAASITVSRFRAVGSRRLFCEDRERIEFIPCRNLFSQVVVGWDGRLGLCCEDINIAVSPGAVGEGGSSIAELFGSSGVLRRYRDAHLKGDVGGLPLCSTCDVWASHHVLDQGERELAGTCWQWVKTPAYERYVKTG